MDKGRTWLKHTIQGGVVQNRVCIVWIKEGLGCITTYMEELNKIFFKRSFGLIK
jgi:hypothetical protein